MNSLGLNFFLIFVAIVNMLLGVFPLVTNKKNKTGISFFLITIGMAMWCSSMAFFVQPSISNEIAYVLGGLIYFGISLMLVSFLIFSYLFPIGDLPKSRLFWATIVLLGAILCFLSVFPKLIFSSISIVDNERIFTLGVGFYIHTIITIILFIITFIKLILKYKKVFTIHKSQLLYFFIGAICSCVNGIIFNALLPSIGISKLNWVGPSGTLILVSFTSYAMIRKGMFDIRLAAVRSVTYSLLIASLAGIYAGSTFVISSVFRFGQSSWAELFGNIAISLVLVFIFQPLRKFFDRITNRVFYKDNYNSDEFFARLNKTLALTTDLRGLLERTASEIGKTLKSSQAFFFINTDNGHFVTAGTKGHTQLSRVDACIFISAPKNKSGLIVSSMDEDDAIKQRLSEHKIEIILPLIQDGDVVGLLCLGENLSSNYTNRDIQVLDTISNGLIIAIQNALSVQQIRDFNVTLRQKINEATQELRVKNAMLKKLDKAKDEFVSMASHQLRTPLTSVKGYLSMVVDGDAGKITAQQKSLLGEAYSSSERMVNLVNDFLNVSRIQTGKFMLEKIPVDLAKLVNEEVNGLVQNAAKRQIKLAYDAPNGVPKLNVDEGKIRQVVMNYIDNAIYYSNMDSTIKIGLSVDNDDVVFTVKDTGIGVPVSEQAGLFTKFYRASNAKKQRPDGTGVGLYLAKKIIKAHDGEIIFETIEGKGSTFGFRLPTKELEVSADKEIENLKD